MSVNKEQRQQRPLRSSAGRWQERCSFWHTPVSPPRQRQAPFLPRLRLCLTGQVSRAHHRTSSFFSSIVSLHSPTPEPREAGKEQSGACVGPGPRRARGTPLSHHGGRAARGGVPLPRLRLAAGRLMAGGGGEEGKPDRPVAQRRDSLASAGSAALARRRRG